MIRRRWLRASLLALCTAGCFHQVVQTGRAPSATVIDKAFVTTWLWGLVPAQPIDVRAQCPTGVAVITTEQSFMNGLAALVTLGIYTPQHVQITCATGTAMIPKGAKEFRVPVGASAAERATVANEAVEQAIETGSPTVLRF